MSKAMECCCGARIVRARLPEEHPELAVAWGRKTWWKADDGSALCYAEDEGASSKDRQARHEPFQEWEDS
jgi:hypothetical protein